MRPAEVCFPDVNIFPKFSLSQPKHLWEQWGGVSFIENIGIMFLFYFEDLENFPTQHSDIIFCPYRVSLASSFSKEWDPKTPWLLRPIQTVPFSLVFGPSTVSNFVTCRWVVLGWIFLPDFPYFFECALPAAVQLLPLTQRSYKMFTLFSFDRANFEIFRRKFQKIEKLWKNVFWHNFSRNN